MAQPVHLPQRHKLPHAIPSWVQQGARHFVTVNCHERDADCLCRGDVATKLLNSARHYDLIGRWYLWLMVVMPDHVHLIATYDLEHGVRKIMKAWKGFQKRNLHVEWQADFFEHRLRDDSEFVEKMHYIRMNPVRKGLVRSPDEWPHVLDRTSLTEDWGCVGRAKPPAEPLAPVVWPASRRGRLVPPSKEEIKNA